MYTGRLNPIYFWNDDEIRTATYLALKDDSTAKFEPVEMYHLPLYTSMHKVKLAQAVFGSHPVLFVFPRNKPDGSPLISTLDEEVELHTHIDDHDVLLRFRLDDLNIDDVTDLQLRVDE